MFFKELPFTDYLEKIGWSYYPAAFNSTWDYEYFFILKDYVLITKYIDDRQFVEIKADHFYYINRNIDKKTIRKLTKLLKQL